jgi:hypothetical protein
MQPLYTYDMDYLPEPDTGTADRLGKQSEFLRGTYWAELAKDPRSLATQSSRSNIIALWHTVRQIYGKSIVRNVFGSFSIKTDRLQESGPFR